MRKTLLTITVLVGLVLGAMPAHAGSLSWIDPENDATDAGVGAAVTPNDPQFDITKLALSADKKLFSWNVGIKKVAAATPSNSTGYYFRLRFSYEGGAYQFIVAEDVTGAKTFTVASTATGSAALACKDCTGVIDRKANAVIVKVPLASFAAAMKAADATKPPFATGSELTGLSVLAQRQMVRATLTSDTATAPEDAVFKV